MSKKRIRKRIIAVMLLVSCMTTTLSGCRKAAEETMPESSQTETAKETQGEPQEEAQKGTQQEAKIDSGQKLWWTEQNPKAIYRTSNGSEFRVTIQHLTDPVTNEECSFWFPSWTYGTYAILGMDVDAIKKSLQEYKE